jgi:hypothetical protein
MASTRIPYSQTTQTGKSVAQWVNDVLSAVASGGRVKALLDQASSGSDWAAVAAEVGGGITPTQAQALWTIVSNAQGAINVAAVAELARLDQG